MLTDHELQKIFSQLVHLLEWDEEPLTKENLSKAFDFTCDDGELCVDRMVTEADKKQFINWCEEVHNV